MPDCPSSLLPVSVIPCPLLDALDLAHPSWRPALTAGLEAVAKADPNYLPALVLDDYLPTQGRLFAAFRQPIENVRYVLVGEGPYPRPESATGVCFMDGAVQSLWSEQGLSRQVNRATSLRNFMKMLLVADGTLSAEHTTGAALAGVAGQANRAESGWIQSLPELQQNFAAQGFLMMNAALVFRPQVRPAIEAKAWRPFIRQVLAALAEFAHASARTPPTLVLWGKVAEMVRGMPESTCFPAAVAEHPYNLSFICQPDMHALFGPMALLRRPRFDQ